MIFEISVFYIIIFFAFYILGYIMHFKVSKKFIYFSFIFFSLSYGILAYYIEPPREWDLYRHFGELNRIRSGSLYYLFNVGGYKDQLGTSLLFYCVSLLPNNHYLPLISIVIEYVIFAYIVSNYCEDNHLNCRYILLILILHFSMNDISWTLSNIRQPLAMSIMALAVYLELYKKKWFGIFFYLIGFMVHPGSVGVILIRLALILYKREIPIHIVMLIWGIFVSTIVIEFEKSQNTWIRFIGKKLYTYVFVDTAKAADIRLVIIKLILLLIIFFMIWIRKGTLRKDDYTKFFFLVFLFTVGSIISEQIFLRYVLFISFLFVPMQKQISPETKKGMICLSDVVIIFLFVGLIAYQYVTLTANNVSFWLE